MNTNLRWEPLSVEHVSLIHDSIDGNVAEYFYNFNTINQTKDWIKDAISLHVNGEKKEYVVFDGDIFIGMISPRFISVKEVDVGLWITTAQQGKGYGKKLLEELFIRMKNIGVERIIYNTEAKNSVSIKLAISTGFSRVKDRDDEVVFIKDLI